MTTRIEDISINDFERVVSVTDTDYGLNAYIAIHDTTLGPGLGGVRCMNYHSREEALKDALELAQAMTLKSSLAGINYGGAKAVILDNPFNDRASLYRCLGSAVQQLGGTYIAVGDVGTSTDDLKTMNEMTKYVAGTELDSGIPTARGVLYAIRAYCDHYSIHPEDLLISISGLGKVGSHLAQLLATQHSDLIVADVFESTVGEVTNKLLSMGLGLPGRVAPNESHRVPCEIFSPCALGHVLNRITRKELNCNAVIGCANNQLAEMETARFLYRSGIFYAPDFLVNAGGVIALAMEIEHMMEQLEDRLIGIGERLSDLLYETHDLPVTLATDWAEDRIDNA